jgi:hypothetical protein
MYVDPSCGCILIPLLMYFDPPGPLQEDPEAMSGQERQAMEKATSTKRLQTLFRIKGGSGEDLGM